MEQNNDAELLNALQEQFGKNELPALKNALNYEDIRTSLALHIKMLMKENRSFLFASLYRIDVSEKDVKLALSQNLSEYILAEMILKKLNEKLYWRKKYSSK